MSKNTKIWLNYSAGAAISLFLLYNIYTQIAKQLAGMNAEVWRHTGNNAWLYLCIALMLVNTTLESTKWYMLTNAAEPTPYRLALSSYLAGIAFSIITPNRIGEYPGRILFLGRKNTFRYINVSVLGVISQLWAVYIWGFAGLTWYNFTYPGSLAKAGLLFCIIINVCIAIAYTRFEAWLPIMQRYKWLRRFAVYGMLLNRITRRRQLGVLAVSVLRFGIFTAQYLFLLRWMNVVMPPVQGFCMAALFFWVMAVIPSLALTELGIRGTVSIYLFGHFSSNAVGIVAASTGIWMLNLIIPSVIGSILILRIRWLR